jgi:hypothetical protein
MFGGLAQVIHRAVALLILVAWPGARVALVASRRKGAMQWVLCTALRPAVTRTFSETLHVLSFCFIHLFPVVHKILCLCRGLWHGHLATVNLSYLQLLFKSEGKDAFIT